jgi:hypothetical protein
LTDAPQSGPLRGRPGTKALPLSNGRAVGGPIALRLLASYFAVALVGWMAAAITLLIASPQLVGRNPEAPGPVLAAHLIALGLLPFVVTGASFHLLPVMLRNDVRHPRRLQLALPLLCGGFLAAPGIAFDKAALVWPGATLVGTGLLLVLSELVGLTWRAPRDRQLVASRTGIVLVSLNITAALVFGALVFSHGDKPVAGIVHERWLLVHLNLAILGWLTLLIVTVGRTLAPMLALAPTPPTRRLPLAELALTLGLWVLLAGTATASIPTALAGASLVVVTLTLFARSIGRVARTRKLELEAPLAHTLAGGLFLAQAATLGIAVLAGPISPRTGLTAYVIFLLLGWAAGVTLGHLGKILSLSLWVWWPPGPRPKQTTLYPRRIWLAEAVAFAAGVELVGVAVLVANPETARAGGVLLILAASLAASGAALTWRSRW